MPDRSPDVSFTDRASCPQQVPLVMMRPVISTAQSMTNTNKMVQFAQMIIRIGLWSLREKTCSAMRHSHTDEYLWQWNFKSVREVKYVKQVLRVKQRTSERTTDQRTDGRTTKIHNASAARCWRRHKNIYHTLRCVSSALTVGGQSAATIMWGQKNS